MLFDESRTILTIVLLLVSSCWSLASAQDGPCHAEVIGRGVLKWHDDRSSLEAEERDELEGLLFLIESRSREGHVLSRNGKSLLAENAFKKSISFFDELQRKYPDIYSKSLVDKAELLEDLARLLRSVKRQEEAVKYELMAREIRQKLVSRPANVRTYSTGYWNTLDPRRFNRL